MSQRWRSAWVHCGVTAAALACTATRTNAADSAKTNTAVPSVQTSSRPVTAATADLTGNHPLATVLEFARQEQEYLRSTVRDFSCRLVKRERIDGFLQDYEYMDMQVREEVRDDQRLITPLSIFLEFQSPKKVAGRRVLFVEGRHDGKMLVRNGGKHFEYVVVEVDPLGETAMSESLVPITQSGFNHILAQMIKVLERHAAIDADGTNTGVRRISGAKINNRPCSVIRITHPKKQQGLEFHIVNVFVDRDLHVPVRVDYSDWPKTDGQQPPLIAEYTYTNLQLNVGLSERTFDPARLKAKH
jgi:hypothetical protein